MALPKHSQDPLNAVLGVLAVVSPGLAGRAPAQPALADAAVVGMDLLTIARGAAVVGRLWVS